jgi:hypothetical protein
MARSILETERRVLDVLASALMSYETLQGPALARALGVVQLRRPSAAVESPDGFAPSRGDGFPQ